jgi:hypothetical protein
MVEAESKVLRDLEGMRESTYPFFVNSTNNVADGVPKFYKYTRRRITQIADYGSTWFDFGTSFSNP